MKSPSNNSELRRCRPLLGTFVEITATGPDERRLHPAINAAFAVIEKIQKLMSAHDANSELSRLNREAASYPVVVSRETFEVLRRADKLAAESQGAFDPTIAPVLASWRILPARLERKRCGTWRDVRLLRGRKVYFRQPLALDLGGIAKGYAVDRAIEKLRESGVSEATVNAGGDLRAFGAQPFWVHLRHPANPQMLAHKIPIQNAALATSSPCFTERTWRGRRVSHLVNSLRRTAVTGAVSVTVRTRECWLADALTKVVLNAPHNHAEAMLERHRAQATVLKV